MTCPTADGAATVKPAGNYAKNSNTRRLARRASCARRVETRIEVVLGKRQRFEIPEDAADGVAAAVWMQRHIALQLPTIQ